MDAIKLTRTMIGAAKPTEALPGTIRGDFTCSMINNLVHGSDSPEAATDEMALWFKPGELLG